MDIKRKQKKKKTKGIRLDRQLNGVVFNARRKQKHGLNKRGDLKKYSDYARTKRIKIHCFTKITFSLI